jgi:radical SAM superfamily enzyme
MAGVKIHLLHVVSGTELQRQFEDGIVRLLGQDDYVERVCDFLERLSPDVIIQRLTGDGGADLVAPEWGRRKMKVLAAIDHELNRRGSRQGFYWNR